MASDTPKTRVPNVLEDPSAQALARVYANAFLDAVGHGNAGGALEEFASFVDDVLGKFPDFNAVLLSGVVSRDKKIRLIDRVVGSQGTPLFVNFLRVLANHDRLDLLPHILNETTIEHERRSNRRRVQVATARPLSEKALASISGRIRESMGFEPILETRLDRSLLGGVIIRIGDTVYDSSLRTRMKQLNERLHERSLHEIQVGRDRFSHSERD